MPPRTRWGVFNVQSSSRDHPGWSQFRWLWSAHTASIFGSQLSTVAIPLLAIASLDADAFDLSLLTAAALAPYLVAGLFIGVWVDRVRKRPLLIAADLARAICIVAIPILVWTDRLTLPNLIALTALHGTLTVVFNVADVSFLPSIVPRSELPRANARLALSTSVARVGGPAAAGAIIGYLSAPIALVIDALSYLVSGLFVSRIRSDGAAVTQQQREPVLRALGQGFATLRHTPILFALVASAGLTSMFGMAFQTVLLIFLVERFDMDAARIGLLLAMGGAGALCGSLLSGRMVRVLGIGPAIVRAQWLFGLAGLMLPAALLLPERAAPVVIGASLFIQLAFNTVREVNGAAVSQAVIPPELLGRTQSTSLVSIKLLEVAGSLAAGALAVAIGSSAAIVILEVGMLFAIAPMIGSPIPAIVSLSQLDAQDA